MKEAMLVRHCLAMLVLVTVVVAGCAGARQPGAADASPAAGANPASSAAAASPAQTSAGPIFSGTHYTSQGHTHLVPNEPDDFVYNSNPPSSGPHRELFTDTFISHKPIPSYIQVHLLEHGNILLQYSCNCPDVAAALAQIAMQYDKLLMPPGEAQPNAADVNSAEDQGKAVIVAPYPGMKSKIALSAWTHVGVLPTVDKQKINSFISVHLGNPTE
jgi:hypothetical protein